MTYDSPELDVWTTDGTPVAIITVDDGRKEAAYSMRPLGEAPQPLCPVAAPAEGADIVAAMVRMANNETPDALSPYDPASLPEDQRRANPEPGSTA
ncbi:hypothetical protein [Sphaerisporangium perillae]|uniref:hypothetical protein n=1 Tax=Sphaerisporangium perillae TaxID=2935860 RepID=UPI00200C83CB|nr:hypothetical protein [Sphaerisporangium perillae]